MLRFFLNQIMFPQYAIEQFEKYLSESQIQTLKILIWLLQVHKQVRIERLASCLPIPILYESRRKHLQRFLVLPDLSIVLFWFPIIKSIIEKEFKSDRELILTIDRTHWKKNNVLMISINWKNRSFPVYWQIIEKDSGCSNFTEQKSSYSSSFKPIKTFHCNNNWRPRISWNSVS